MAALVFLGAESFAFYLSLLFFLLKKGAKISNGIVISSEKISSFPFFVLQLNQNDIKRWPNNALAYHIMAIAIDTRVTLSNNGWDEHDAGSNSKLFSYRIGCEWIR